MIWKYLLTAALAVTVPAVGYAFTSLADRVAHMEEGNIIRAERLAGMEAEVKGLRLQMDRIEEKLNYELREHHSGPYR